MASPKSPTQQTLLPLIDPDDVEEVLVTELTGSFVIAGNLHMEMSIARPHHESTTPGVATIKQKRVVRLRPVMPLAAVPDMINQLQQIMQQETARISLEPVKPN